MKIAPSNTHVTPTERGFRGTNRPRTSICKNRKRSLVEEIPRKKQFQCRTSIKKLGNAKEESSSVNKIPESGGKVYKAGAIEPIICDYAHDTRCDGKCLIWKDKFRVGP
jgi:hypothetical protein